MREMERMRERCDEYTHRRVGMPEAGGLPGPLESAMVLAASG